MDDRNTGPAAPLHSHVFLGEEHEESERRTWIVIGVCAVMMAAEIGGGYAFGSIALVADGLHMSTHAGAMLLAALAYMFARHHATDTRFSFGTGKLGDLAGFTSAIVLTMIAMLICYEAIGRLFAPIAINFPEAIAIACLGLIVNVVTALILSGGDHPHPHHHASHSHDHDERKEVTTGNGVVTLEIFETEAPPRFRLSSQAGPPPDVNRVRIETLRPGGARQAFAMVNRGSWLESVDEIPEPHDFVVALTHDGETSSVAFEEHEHAHGKMARDNNMRAAIIHIAADAAVSILVIVGLILARVFGWLWIDPAVGLVGAIVIASWAFGLIRDTGAILLDMTPDADMWEKLRRAVEDDGDEIVDLHLWRIGPGHLGAILCVATARQRGADYYRERLARFRSLSHLTIEVRPAA